MKIIWCLSAALVFIAAPVAAQKTSPYTECKKSGKSANECKEFMDPQMRKSLERSEETAKKQMESLEQNKRKDEEWRRRVQSGR